MMKLDTLMSQTKFLFLISFLANLSFAKNDIESIIRVADSFYADLRFDLAIIEYKRAVVLYPENEYEYQLLNKIALCNKKLGYFIEAINIHKNLLEKGENHWDSIFETASTYQLMGRFSDSNHFIKKYLTSVDGGKKDSLIYLMACNYFALMQVDSSKFYFNSIKEKEFQTIIDRNSTIISQFESLKKYNHVTAKYLNILFPGSGYLYLDMPQTFIATLFVESLFLYATVMTYKNQYAIGTLFGGLFFSGFYLGSIYGAEQFAKKKKKNLYRKYYDNIIFSFNKS